MNSADETSYMEKKASCTYHHHNHRYCCHYCNLDLCILLDQKLLAQSYGSVPATQILGARSFCLGQETLARDLRSGMDDCSFCLDVGMYQESFAVGLEIGRGGQDWQTQVSGVERVEDGVVQET